LAVAPEGRPGRLTQSRELEGCRSALRPHLANFGYTHFYVVSPETRLVAASEDDLPRTFQADFGRSFVRKVLREGSALSRPHRAAALLPDAGGELAAG